MKMPIYGDTLHRPDIRLTFEHVAYLVLIAEYNIITDFQEFSIYHLQRL